MRYERSRRCYYHQLLLYSPTTLTVRAGNRVSVEDPYIRAYISRARCATPLYLLLSIVSGRLVVSKRDKLLGLGNTTTRLRTQDL